MCAMFAESECVCACAAYRHLHLFPLIVRSASVDKMYIYKLVQLKCMELCTDSICMDNMHTTYLYKCILM